MSLLAKRVTIWQSEIMDLSVKKNIRLSTMNTKKCRIPIHQIVLCEMTFFILYIFIFTKKSKTNYKISDLAINCLLPHCKAWRDAKWQKCKWGRKWSPLTPPLYLAFLWCLSYLNTLHFAVNLKKNPHPLSTNHHWVVFACPLSGACRGF